WHKSPNEEKRNSHHQTVKDKRIITAIRTTFGDNRKEPRNNGSHDPMGETTERATLRANAIREYLRDKNPDYRTLRKGKECNKTDQINQHRRSGCDTLTKSMGNQAQKHKHS